ncbi:TlpA family protein disulfide reductase [Bacillus sp. HMF5848]
MLLSKMKNVTLSDLTGNDVYIDDFKGKKTLLFMWASW